MRRVDRPDPAGMSAFARDNGTLAPGMALEINRARLLCRSELLPEKRRVSRRRGGEARRRTRHKGVASGVAHAGRRPKMRRTRRQKRALLCVTQRVAFNAHNAGVLRRVAWRAWPRSVHAALLCRGVIMRRVTELKIGRCAGTDAEDVMLK